jgi:hypothetical protein
MTKEKYDYMKGNYDQLFGWTLALLLQGEPLINVVSISEATGAVEVALHLHLEETRQGDSFIPTESAESSLVINAQEECMALLQMYQRFAKQIVNHKMANNLYDLRPPGPSPEDVRGLIRGSSSIVPAETHEEIFGPLRSAMERLGYVAEKGLDGYTYFYAPDPHYVNRPDTSEAPITTLTYTGR